MRMADRIFSTAADTTDLLQMAVEALAAQPGHACLISLLDGEGTLRPVCVAHAGPEGSVDLRPRLLAAQPTVADAFSRAVQRSGGSLRMRIGNPRLWRLWLPPAYWTYADQVHVAAVLAAALSRHGRVVGTLLLWREGASARCFTAADQAFVTAMAGRLALGLP